MLCTEPGEGPGPGLGPRIGPGDSPAPGEGPAWGIPTGGSLGVDIYRLRICINVVKVQIKRAVKPPSPIIKQQLANRLYSYVSMLARDILSVKMAKQKAAH